MSIENKLIAGKNATIVDKKGVTHVGDILAISGDYVHVDVPKVINGIQRRSTVAVYAKGIKSLIYNN